jgi:endonuclease/exonuclease/phosphatase family metal-dependent hydrolase
MTAQQEDSGLLDRLNVDDGSGGFEKMRRNVRIQHVIVAAALGALLVGAQSAAAGTAHRAAPSHREAGSTATPEQLVTVMTYDIRDLLADGTPEGGTDIAPWSKRAPKEAGLIRKAHPDVIAIQEGSSHVGSSTTERQVDSLRHAIGGTYRVAHTEIRAPQPHSFRTGDYIIYNHATLKVVGKGSHFGIGSDKFAAYDEFANRETGAKFLFVSTHLLVGLSHQDDLTREAETKTILSKAGGIAKRRHIPVIYAGNFNSPDPKVGTGKAMKAAHAKDALAVAPKRTHAQYNSDNEYLRTPPHNGIDIDHIYAPAGVKVVSAGVVLNLHHGRFVGVIPSDHNPVVAGLRYPY